jgi:thioredoxin reductase (NADPH)
MPEMSGIEFPKATMDLFPWTRRALLTAYADTDAATAAINLVDVDYYLLKPWEPPKERLYAIVDATLEAHTGQPG